MRLLVFFDLPVKTASEKKNAAAFRKFLVNDGYYMLQYSVYVRICNGADAVSKHEKRIRAALPPSGSIRMISITEKQFESMTILLGKPMAGDSPFLAEQLTIF